MAVINLMNRRAALREMEVGQVILWSVTAETVTLEMKMMADAAYKVGVKITQQFMLTVSPSGDQLPLKSILIERIL